ncbi:MAG: ABC transporter ATP-binding protein, partial [Halorhodospira sp.]
LAELPGQIEALEAEQARLHEQLADPALYQRGDGRLQELQQQLAELEARLEQGYERWQELEERSQGA